MFLNSWSIALSLISLMVITLGLLASRTAIRVLRFWDADSDSNLQIKLENETWLASTLVEYGLGFQIVSLVLLALAADNFSKVIVGAMCATGAFTANQYGMASLFIKMAGVFVYGYWIVLHHLDISSETYPLLKVKYTYLVLLLPLLVTDIVIQTLYIANLEPDIITSCCAVVFGEDTGKGSNLLGAFSRQTMLPMFFGWAVLLAVHGATLLRSRAWPQWLALSGSLLWLLYFFLALVVITTIFSSFIYAMPYHRCPFCILKPEYNYIGLAIYGTLIPACFFGMTPALAGFFGKNPSLTQAVQRYQRLAVKLSLALLIAFLCFSTYHWLVYRFMGGES